MLKNLDRLLRSGVFCITYQSKKGMQREGVDSGFFVMEVTLFKKRGEPEATILFEGRDIHELIVKAERFQRPRELGPIELSAQFNEALVFLDQKMRLLHFSKPCIRVYNVNISSFPYLELTVMNSICGDLSASNSVRAEKIFLDLKNNYDLEKEEKFLSTKGVKNPAHSSRQEDRQNNM